MPTKVTLSTTEPAAPKRADSYTAEEEASVADCLVRQLEDSDGEEDDLFSSNDAGGPNAHVAAAWKDLQYTSFLCGTYHFVKEKRRAEGFLQRELARAEAELGKDGRYDRPRKRLTLEVMGFRVQRACTAYTVSTKGEMTM